MNEWFSVLWCEGVGEIGGGAGGDDTATPEAVHHTASRDRYVQPKCE